jgi:hypothetical protein
VNLWMRKSGIHYRDAESQGEDFCDVAHLTVGGRAERGHRTTAAKMGRDRVIGLAWSRSSGKTQCDSEPQHAFVHRVFSFFDRFTRVTR